jgi:hypothetical protein
MNTKIKPLRKDFTNEMIGAYNLYSKYTSVISKRVDYVVREIARIFGGKIDWWDWPKGKDECDGHFTPDIIEGESVSVDGWKSGGGDWEAYLKDEKGDFKESWQFCWFEFPTRFLYEDFEEELIEGIKKYREDKATKKELKKQKELEKVKNKAKLLDSVKSKLTKEERKALGL